MSILELLKIRYLRPLNALKDDLLIKSVASTIAVFLSSIFNVFHTIGDILKTPPELVLLLLLAILLDWFTGIQCARRNDVFIRSLGLRQTVVKILEYAAFLLILTGMANVFGRNELVGWIGESLSYLKNIHWFGYFYLTFTELKSISENVQGKKGRFAEIIHIINRKFFGEKDDDDIR